MLGATYVLAVAGGNAPVTREVETMLWRDRKGKTCWRRRKSWWGATIKEEVKILKWAFDLALNYEF